MAKANRGLTLLYPLRKPFTHASLKRNQDSADISLEIDGGFAGTIRVPSGRLPAVLLGVLADVNRTAGHMDDEEIEWAWSPDVYGYTVIIDDTGTLWNVRGTELRRV